MPKVSVILPIYNVAKYLRKCLDSVINQTLKDIEIICINDCSADNCENIILEYAKKDGRIKIINNEKNYGIGFSRNIGINESSGEYISFIDADDYIEKDYIEILYNTAIKNKADIVFTNNINIVRDKIIKPYYHNRINIWKKKFKKNETWKEGISDFNVNTPEKENTPEYPLVSTVNKIFKKDFIEKNNLKFQNYIVSEDTEFFYKYLLYSPKKFYNNELVILTEDKGEEDVMKVYITVKGSHARGHYNQRQIDIIDKEIMPELKQKLSVDEIGIVSPYNEQKIRLQDAINNENIQIDTVHKYQGREKDAIIITTVNNKISEFIDDPKMLNVAITRSKRFLRLVVSRDICEKDGNINDLVKYIKYNNFEVIESNVKSIFDLLYKENRLARLQYLKNKKRISLFDSENIAYNEIENILKNNYNNLGIITHIPLFRILENKNLLNKDELKYASHEWTHIDFVIYNKMDKKPSLAIEVDGYAFHKKSTAQSQRDELKNEILKKYNIPLIRLSTIGSDEKNIIKSKLDELYMQM